MAIATTSISASIAAENTFSTNWLAMIGVGGSNFNLSLSGTWVATVYLQRSFDSGVTWLDIASYTANIEDTGFEPEGGVLYRFGVKTGGYTSGTVVGRISR
jgi:hypothetical protein